MEQIEPLQLIGQGAEFSPEDCSRRQPKALTAKSVAELLELRSDTGWVGRTVKHQHRAFPSWRQLLLAATASLEEKVLPLLL